MKHTDKMLRLVVLTLACMFFTCSCIDDGNDGTAKEDRVKTGDAIPAFTVRMNDGKTTDSRGLAGKPALIVFFNTECGDCRKELPIVQEAYERYGKTGEVNFVAISREQDAKSIQEYWDGNGLTLPYSAQNDRKVYNLFAYTRIPRIYVADSFMKVRAIYTDNPIATAEELTRSIESVLGGNPEQ